MGGSPYQTASGPNSAAAGDLNGDGKVDLVTADNDNSMVTVMLGDGAADPTFPSNAQFPVGEYPYAVVIDDFNRDGKTRSGHRQLRRQRLRAAGRRPR